MNRKIQIEGNPGSGNSFNETTISQVGNYNPAATVANTNIYYTPTDNRLNRWFQKFKMEFENDITIQKKIDDIKRYRTKLSPTIGLNRKMEDAGFSAADIDKACRKKQYFLKKATKYQYYESAQLINSYLFGMVCNRFERHVWQLIEDQRPLREINNALYDHVVIPVMAELNTSAVDDIYLCYNEDDIFGMIYYLTGNCHINWKVYDV